ncbi:MULTISPECIES: UDP-4-amino-4,6-dideoxy-N-acetyl-beta-L-altrosamine N-acetyltransferase [Nostoc]|uniref:UDP-4-amino-4, 6-dideoxy-N-acetyl-beta-L-altrosamine N-acetyltransferase n=1 Tax=Nostoc paludosum FACHB-159 TaxID=2692908 RepID=A0ABR8KBA8_9NOSO|nr:MULTISPECIES: UDP-4-amino-4,6-dideoxy-N-acetyl-beta-L-altrosamine N-acetyltransferase [Nostoc]MBD2680432.1 UDP-4-amino-4,6-dideoxy-N-acetyl-beta-L-altrosamine N-acetyltransferase [Nostoc sp. FACHB-857]MBD2736821.1 UDP-4-amino-4,6-dideoxy-N-acetyl-beta-L-altrosamine N-acetyltransferase [Nostoc paludosum FACHB-159]
MGMPKREEYRLRPLQESDLEQLLEWRNSDRIRANMYSDHIITMDEHRKWFENNSKNESVIYKIFEFQERPVGVANVVQIDTHNEKCSWAFYLGDTNVPRGSGAVMEFIFLEYIFEVLKIRKLCCEVFAFNVSTIKLHKKFGFIEEGCFKRHILKNDKYEDVVSMALFSDEWIIKKSQIETICFGSN